MRNRWIKSRTTFLVTIIAFVFSSTDQAAENLREAIGSSGVINVVDTLAS